MEYTTNYNLKKPDDNDLYTQEVQNDNMDIIDAALQNQSAGSGELSSLTTTEKTSLVGAINELDGNIGDLSGLTTTAKTNLVNAVNELNQNMNGFINGSRLPSNVTNSIIETVKPLDIGIYLLYTQNAVDAPESSNASFTIVNKAGTNNFIFLYNYVYERIYYSSMNSETTELSWTKMNNL